MNREKVMEEWENTWKNFPSMRLNILARTHLNIVKNMIKNMVKNIPRDIKICDVGCGTGRSMSWYKKMGFDDIIGIDSSETSINHCRKLGYEVYCMDAFDTGFEDEEIDLIHSEGLIEHFKKSNLDPFVKEMCRISKNHVLLVQPNRKSVYRKLVDIYYKLIPEKGPPEKDYKVSEFIKSFKKNGFLLKKLYTTPLGGFWILLFERNEG